MRMRCVGEQVDGGNGEIGDLSVEEAVGGLRVPGW